MEDGAASREVLAFKLGTEEYGIDILAVQEIRSYEAATRIANAPPFIKSVVNLRGVIVPVVDMRIRFAMGRALSGDYLTGLGTVGDRMLILLDIVQLTRSSDLLAHTGRLAA